MGVPDLHRPRPIASSALLSLRFGRLRTRRVLFGQHGTRIAALTGDVLCIVIEVYPQAGKVEQLPDNGRHQQFVPLVVAK